MKDICKRALGWLLMAALTVCAACFFGSALTVDAEAAGTIGSYFYKTVDYVYDGYWVSTYATEEFAEWVTDTYGDDITLAEWIKLNDASSWISVSGQSGEKASYRVNRYLLEGCLLYQYYESIGEANATNDEYSIYLHEGMEQEAMTRTIVHIIGGIADAQYANGAGDSTYDCIMHASDTVDCLTRLGIVAFIRNDTKGALEGTCSANHYNVVAYPYGTDDDDPYWIIEDDGMTKITEETERWEITVVDYDAKTCRVVNYNGLYTETLEIPKTITSSNSTVWTVVEVYSGIGTVASYEKGTNLSRGLIDSDVFSDYLLPTTTIIVPSTVTTLDANAFGNTTVKSVTTVVGMTGVTDIADSAFPDTVTTLNFLSTATTGSEINVIPARLAESWYCTLDLGSIAYEEGTTEVGATTKSYNIDTSGITSIYLPDSLVTINNYVFRYATGVTEIFIPDTVTSIGEKSFSTNLTTIYGISGSYAETYAETYGIDFVAVTDVTTSDYSRTWTVQSYDIADATITPSFSSTAYTGSALKPAVTVTLNGKTLTNGTDYTVTYTNNTNAGTATIKVTCMGVYTGSGTATFTITAKSLNSATVTLGTTSYTYTGSACKPSVTVKDGSKTLTSGTNYTVAYSNNTNAGTATVTVTGKGNYKGTKTATFTISKASQTITVGSTSLTVGKGSTATISVSGNKGTLSFSSSNTSVATVSNSGVVTGKAAGTATITMKAGSTSNYNASSSKTVKVTVTTLKNLADTSLTTVTLSTVNYTPTADNLPDETITYNGTTLTRCTHYSRTFSGASENVCNDAGTYTVTFTGIESAGYTGSVTKTYTVTQRLVSNGNVMSWSLSSDSYTYTGSACEPTVSGLYSSSQSGETAVPVLNTDYTVSYSSNTDAGTATVTIKGIGNYRGTKTLKFTINKASQTLSLSASSTSIYYGATTTVNVNGAKTGLAYSSSSTSVGTVSSSGVVTAKGAGSTTITVTAASSNNYNSASATIKISVSLKPPSLSSVSNANGGVTVKWSAVSGAAKYRVFRKVSGGSWAKVADTTSTSYTDKTAKSGTTYIYTVRCINSAGSSYTSSYNSTGKTIKYLSVPSLSSVSNGSSGLTITWGKVTGASKYRVYRKTAGGSWVKMGDTTSTSYTDKTAKAGTLYYYTVRAINGSYMSYYNTSGKANVRLATPTLSSVKNASSKKMTVSWKKVSGVTGYQIQYSTSSSFSSAKTATVSSASTTSKTISSLTKGKTYYVRIRTYKTVSGTIYYSAWSSTKTVKIST